jgi:hypothetical protein
MSYLATSAQWSEAERLKSLLEYDILDTPADPAFDEIVRVAAQATGAPFAYLGFLDANRLWFKSRFGFQGTEIPRLATADQYTILEPEPLLIADAAMEPRFPVRGIPLTGRYTAARIWLRRWWVWKAASARSRCFRPSRISSRSNMRRSWACWHAR